MFKVLAQGLLFGVLVVLDSSQPVSAAFISPDQAQRLFEQNAKIKQVQKSSFGDGVSTGAGLQSKPTEEAPYYVFYVSLQTCKKTIPANCLMEEFNRIYFILDAKSGKWLEGQNDVPKNIRDKILRPPWLPSESENAEQVPTPVKEEICGVCQNRPQTTPPPMTDQEISLEKRIDEIQKQLNEAWMGVNQQKLSAAFSGFTPELISVLLKPHKSMREKSLRIIAWVGRINKNFREPHVNFQEFIPAISPLINDPDDGIRYNALEALSSIAPRGDQKLIGAILPHLQDCDRLVCYTSVTALGSLGDHSLIPKIISLLDHESLFAQAIPALGNLGDSRAAIPLLDCLDKKKFLPYQGDILRALEQTATKEHQAALSGLLGRKLETSDRNHGAVYMGKFVVSIMIRADRDSAASYFKIKLQSTEEMERLFAAHGFRQLKKKEQLGNLQERSRMEKSPLVLAELGKAIAAIEGKTYQDPRAESLRLTVQKVGGAELKACIQNRSLKSVVIHKTALEYPSGIFEVTRWNGEKAPYIGPMYKTDYSPGEESLKTLLPWISVCFREFRLSEYFDVKSGEQYRISACYQNHFDAIEFGKDVFTGELRSEELLFE